jgi:hypothetical protein
MNTAVSARKPSQAGKFYPADERELLRDVERFLQAAPERAAEEPAVGFVAPHAGYSFSGATAGHTYRRLKELAPPLIFVAAPSHHAAFPLASMWDGPAYATPLGEYPIDQEAAACLRKRLPGIGVKKWADEIEHALEVQVPFLQVACPKSHMVPLLLGAQDRHNVEMLAKGIATICEGMSPGQVAFVASSDAYHGNSLDECRAADRRLAGILAHMDVEALYQDVESRRAMACGHGPIALVMELSRHMGARRGTILHQATSADVLPHRAGDYVVGYLSVMFH